MNIYSPPEATISPSQQPKRVMLGKVLAVVSLLMLFSVLGVGWMVWAFFELFDGARALVEFDFSSFWARLMMSALSVIYAQLPALIGWIAAPCVYWVTDFRHRFFRRYCWFCLPFALLSFPAGTVLGIALLVTLMRSRK